MVMLNNFWLISIVAGSLLLSVSNSAASAVGTASKGNPIVGSQCSKNQVVRKLTVYEDGALEAECGPVPCGEVGRRCIDDQTACRADTDVFSGMRWAPNGESILLRCCTMKTGNKIYVGTDIVSAGSFYEGGAVAKQDLYAQTGGAEYDFIANARTEQGGVRVWVYRMICEKDEKPVNFEPITTTTATPTTSTSMPSTTKKQLIQEKEEAEATEGEEEEEEEAEEADNGQVIVNENNDNNGNEDEEADEEEEEVEEEEEETTTTTIAPKPFNPLRYRPPHVPRSSTGVRRA